MADYGYAGKILKVDLTDRKTADNTDKSGVFTAFYGSVDKAPMI